MTKLNGPWIGPLSLRLQRDETDGDQHMMHKLRGLLSAQATVFTHQLEVLLRLTDGIDRLRQNEEHWRLFNMVNRWVPAWRYTADLSNPEDANDFLAAVDKVSHWIENNI